jgi:hypothetical protein
MGTNRTVMYSVHRNMRERERESECVCVGSTIDSDGGRPNEEIDLAFGGDWRLSAR